MVADKASVRPAHKEEIPQAVRTIWRGFADSPRDVEAEAEWFLKYLNAQNLRPTWCFVVASHRELLGGCLGVAMPGRTATVLVSDCDLESELCQLTSQSLRRLEDAARAQGLALLQALSAQGAVGQARALELAAYQGLAELQYMALKLEPPAVCARAPAGLTAEPYRPESKRTFRLTLLRTHEGSLDCSGLIGLRTTEDLLRSYQSVGLHDPNLWFLLRKAHEPVGVLLLTKLPLLSAMEVIYLGVVPEARGSGYGAYMVQFAIERAARANCRHLTLAVDTSNRFALTLYRSAGFFETKRRNAWLKAL